MIILCADDYGISVGVSRGIRELAAAGRLSATSAMVTFDGWLRRASRLADLRSTAAVGLHVNLTLGRPLLASPGAPHLEASGAFRTLGPLLGRSLVRALDRTAIAAEIRAQIDAFAQATGSLPDFIDGHQHVHVLPVVRHALFDAIADVEWLAPPLIRIPANRNFASRFKQPNWSKEVIVATFALGFRRSIEARQLPANHSFAGFSSFRTGRSYATELTAFLDAATGPCHLIMCHPGYADDELRRIGDPIIERREEEMGALKRYANLPDRIWHPARNSTGAIDWHEAISSAAAND